MHSSKVALSLAKQEVTSRRKGGPFVNTDQTLPSGKELVASIRKKLELRLKAPYVDGRWG